MIILGIDPALNNTGWAVIEVSNANKALSYIASGIIKNNTSNAIDKKLVNIANSFGCIVDKYKPNQAGIEEVFVNVNPVSSLKLGMARGVVIATVAQKGVVVFEYKPNTIKKTITGAGKADKSQVAYMIKYLLPLANFSSNDESDAIAIALTHAIIGG